MSGRWCVAGRKGAGGFRCGARGFRSAVSVASPGAFGAMRGARVGSGLAGQAVGMFAVTNIDDLLVLTLFFGQAAGRQGAVTRVVTASIWGSR